VAVALLLALIAIPVLLSSSADTKPTAAPAPAAPAVSGGVLSAFQPVVSTEGKKSSEIRKDLEGFDTKDPFEPQNLGGGGSGGTGEVAGGGAAVTPLGGATGAEGGSVTPDSGSTDSGSTGSSPPAGDTSTGSSGATTQPETFYYAYTTDVRFGKQGNLDRKTLSQFRALPSSQDPVVVFMGVKDDGETAIFLLSSAASSTGEGNCEPDDTCTFLYMKKGDKQSFEAVAGNNEVVTYELVLLDIDVERTDGPEKAKASSRKARSTRKANASRKASSERKAERAKRRARVRGFQGIGF
jgi:hypothetical protein